MKKQNLKYLLHLIISVLCSFVFIYLVVFFGGWRLFEPFDVIKMEIGVSFLVGTIMFIVFEITKALENKINELEKRLTELENKTDNKQG